MSNPGVVTLETFSLQPGMPVRIEDNLGESVHVHVGPFRLDLTLDELEDLAVESQVLLDTYLSSFGISVANFDKEFLGQIGHMLVDLESANFEKVAISEMLVTVKRTSLRPIKVVSIAESDVIQAMRSHYDGYERTFGSDAIQARARIERVREIAANENYGRTGEYIILFNDQMFIRDGQHRAAAIYSEDPSATIEVLRLRFRGGRHSIPRFLFLSSLLQLRIRHVRRMMGIVLRYTSHINRRIISKINRIRNARANSSR